MEKFDASKQSRVTQKQANKVNLKNLLNMKKTIEKTKKSISTHANTVIDKAKGSAESLSGLVTDITHTVTEGSVRIAVSHLRNCIDAGVNEWNKNPAQGTCPILTVSTTLPGISLEIQVGLSELKKS